MVAGWLLGCALGGMAGPAIAPGQGARVELARRSTDQHTLDVRQLMRARVGVILVEQRFPRCGRDTALVKAQLCAFRTFG